MNNKISMKAARVNAGMTQKEAALKLGVTKDTVGNWERGRSFPSIKIIPKIEKMYKVKYENIIFLPQNNAISVNEAQLDTK